MADGTHIQWTDATWSPVTGCSRISEGCDHCYIERTMPFRVDHRRFDKAGVGGTTGVRLHSDRLGQPQTWRKPRLIFVCSMADLFHEQVPDRFIADVFAVMAIAQQHTFQVLTKRPARMRSLLTSPEFREAVQRSVIVRVGSGAPWLVEPWWPLANVWCGVSVENQRWADIRIPILLDTPAAVRWLSCEPLLGPVDLGTGDPHRGHESDDVHGAPHPKVCLTCSTDENEVAYFRRESGESGIDWVVVGGESGPGSRPMHPDWAQALRDQCAQSGTAFFMKQLGDWTWEMPAGRPTPRTWMHTDGRTADQATAAADGGSWQGMWRVGKKAAGRHLDGVTHDEYPTPVHA